MVFVHEVGTSRAVFAGAARYTARCYCILLAVHIRVWRVAACYTCSRATCCRFPIALVIPNEIQDALRNVTFSPESMTYVIIVLS